MSPQPRIHYDDDRRVQRARLLLVLLGLLLLALVAGDWFMRFYWFRWQDVFKAPPRHPGGAVEAFSSRQIPPQRGGDLSNFITAPDLRTRYEEEHPGGEVFYDPAGFANLPYAADTRFDVVVVGDSYLSVGMPQTNKFNARLAGHLGQPVLNRAVAGRGPFQSILQVLRETEQGGLKPRLLVWGFIEREIVGSSFVGFISQLQTRPDLARVQTNQPVLARFPWVQLYPATLRSSLPNSSAVAQFSRKVWHVAQSYGAGRLPSEVLDLEGPDVPDPMLGYTYALTTMYMDPSERRLDLVVMSVSFIRDYLAERGIQLVVVPIPDKEQVYRDILPRSAWRQGKPPFPSILPALADQLQAKGISCVNLLPYFEEARRQGVLLYWRDDTHWNNRGIDLAAERVAETVRRIFPAQE